MWLLVLVLAWSERAPEELAAGMGAFRAQVGALTAAAEADPENPQAPLRLAQVYGARGVLEPALRWAGEAARRGAHPLRIHLLRGDAYLAARQPHDALREYFEVAVSAPSNAYAQVQVWRCLRLAPQVKGVDTERIRAVLDERGLVIPARLARPADPAAAAERSERGTAALHAGRLQEAEEAFRAALAYDEGLADAHRGLALVFTALGQQERALGAWRVFVELAPANHRETRLARQRLDDAERRRGLSTAGHTGRP